jgi:hypothetical protein
MSNTQQVTAGIVAVTLVVLYSIVMTTSGGTAASWAWVLLLGAFALLGWIARSAVTARAERRGG